MAHELPEDPALHPNAGIVFIDIDPNVWQRMPFQGKVLTILHTLVDFTASPAFHMAEGARMQIKHPGILIPQEVVFHVGKKGTLTVGAN